MTEFEDGLQKLIDRQNRDEPFALDPVTLKPCRKCGGQGVRGINPVTVKSCVIGCKLCGFEMREHSFEEVINSWNGAV